VLDDSLETQVNCCEVSKVDNNDDDYGNNTEIYCRYASTTAAVGIKFNAWFHSFIQYSV